MTSLAHELLDVVRLRAIPSFYVLKNDLSILVAWPSKTDAVSATYASGKRLAKPLEAAVRDVTASWLDARRTRSTVAIVADTIVIRVEHIAFGDIACFGLIVEQLRLRNPLQNAIERFGLTRRETSVLELIIAGEGTSTIARKLGIAVTTVLQHIKSISSKTDAHSRAEIVSTVVNASAA